MIRTISLCTLLLLFTHSKAQTFENYESNFSITINVNPKDTLHVVVFKDLAQQKSGKPFFTRLGIGKEGEIEERAVFDSIGTYSSIRYFQYMTNGSYYPSNEGEVVGIFLKDVFVVEGGKKYIYCLILSRSEYDKYFTRHWKKVLIQNIALTLSQ